MARLGSPIRTDPVRSLGLDATWNTVRNWDPGSAQQVDIVGRFEALVTGFVKSYDVGRRRFAFLSIFHWCKRFLKTNPEASSAPFTAAEKRLVARQQYRREYYRRDRKRRLKYSADYYRTNRDAISERRKVRAAELRAAAGRNGQTPH